MKKSDPLAPLTPKKRKYVAERTKGKSKMQAAKDAGFSHSMARVAGAKIETPDVRRAFQALIREKIPASKVAGRLAEGLDAMETEFAKEKGMITDSRDVVAWSERREYLKLAAEYGGYFVPKQEFEITALPPEKRRERVLDMLREGAQRIEKVQ
jgi:phage terminase small subunit